MLTHDQNRHTQPHRTLPVFNNWDVIAKGWYVACRSDELRAGEIRPVVFNGQRLVVYRGEDGKARALDAYCPHMGTDLAIGKVEGDSIRCFFHHWRFDGSGKCVEIPCQKDGYIPKSARLHGYATDEKYGCVWVWPEAVAPAPVPEFPALAGEEVEVLHFAPFERPCHHHVAMINGLDPQHLFTVHNLNIDMALKETEDPSGRIVEYVLSGKVPSESFVGKATRLLLGPEYSYGMRYVDGCIGYLTTMRNVHFQGHKLPELYTIYAYAPVTRGTTRVHTMFVTKRRKGALGLAYSRFLLQVSRAGYLALQGEDGQVYDNMRFSPNALLPLDAPVAKFIAYANRLIPSIWSNHRPEEASLNEG